MRNNRLLCEPRACERTNELPAMLLYILASTSTPLYANRWRTVAYVSIRQHTSAYVSIRHILASTSTPVYANRWCTEHTSAHVSTRQHTSAYVSIRQPTSADVSRRQHTSADVSKRQHTSAYVSIRQHTSAYVSIRQHTSAYVSIRHISASTSTPSSVNRWRPGVWGLKLKVYEGRIH
jgi:hypothetical protein